MKKEMMVWTWAGWEPLQFYRRFGGFHEQQEGNALWAEDWSRLLHSEQTAAALAGAGINWVTAHFYKGFGIEIEAQEIAETAKLIRRFHKHGVRVFTYLQYGTIVPETIVAEEPAAANWGRRDWNGRHDGHPYEYGDQYWRAKPCANQPGFREYLLKAVARAVEIGADGIWIDNLNADGCHCPACQDAFRAYLGRVVRDPWREFGVRDISRLTIPRAERPRDPLFQAWVRCRCEEVQASVEMLCAHARKLKPDIVMAANIGIGNRQRHVLDNANWFSVLKPLDFTYAENSLFPAWRDGRIITQHFPMMIGEAVGPRIVPGAGAGARSRLYPRPALPHSRSLRRCFAESAMYGGHAYGGPWGLRAENAGEPPLWLRETAYRSEHRRLVDWYAAQHSLFADSTNAAPVALLYSMDAMLGDEPASQQVLAAWSQLLLRNQIPFRYVLSDALDALGDLRLIVLPHVLPLSDAAAERLCAFAGKGGIILATGRSSLYDEFMRQRRDYALADVFGVSFSNAFEDENHDALRVNPENGCMLVPGEWGLMMGPGEPACRLPERRLVQAIRRALSATSLPEIASPARHVACAWRRLAGGGHLLALLNYADKPVRRIAIRFRAGKGAPFSVTLLVPGQRPVSLRGRRVGPRQFAVSVPALDVESFLLMGV
jgi:hypothetical protein